MSKTVSAVRKKDGLIVITLAHADGVTHTGHSWQGHREAGRVIET
ncbi:MAG TPA: hypothetical protein VLN56_03815 [Gammaproteobacteria bacterium]|nr:hypothetical protein [Gammaproteobacteria bacterium]